MARGVINLDDSCKDHSLHKKINICKEIGEIENINEYH